MTETPRQLPAVLANNPNTPTLEGWIGITEAGERLGYTRQYTFRLAKNGFFKSLHRLGTSHVVVIAEKEIEDILQSRAVREELSAK